MLRTAPSTQRCSVTLTVRQHRDCYPAPQHRTTRRTVRWKGETCPAARCTWGSWHHAIAPPPHPYIWPEDSQLGQRRQEGCLSPQASTTISSQRAQNKASSQPRLQNNEELSLDAAWVRHSVATTRNTTQRHKQKGKYPERNTSKDEITKFFSLSTFLCFILSSQLQPKTHSGFWLVQWTSGANSALGLG